MAEVSRTSRNRRTSVLGVVVVILLLVGAGEVYLLRDDTTPAVSAARPVVAGELTQRAAVEAAARATGEILSADYEDYDDEVTRATAAMTANFAARYRRTAAGIRDRFLAQRTRLRVKAVARGVVQASPARAKALLFLDQAVQKRVGGRPRTAFA